MKRLLLIALGLLLAAFTAEASANIEVIETDTDNRASGRTLYKVMNLNESVFEFVDGYVQDEMPNGYGYTMTSVIFSEDDHAIRYLFDLAYAGDVGNMIDYTLEVYAIPTEGVGQWVLHHKEV